MKNFYPLVIALIFCISFNKINAQNAKDNYKSALILKTNEKYQEAISTLDKAIEQNGNYTEAYLLRGMCYDKINKQDAALKDYKKVLSLEPDNLDAQEGAANIYTIMGNYKEAVNLYSTLSLNKKKALIAHRQLAYVKIKQKDFKGSLDNAEAALNINSDDFYTNFYKGIALDSLANYQSALKSYEKAINSLLKDKKNKETLDKNQLKFFYINPAKSSAELKLYDNAMNYFNQANEVAPNDYDVFFHRALVRLKRDDLAGANSDLNSAIGADGNRAEAFIKRGFIQIKLAQYENAITDFSRAITLDSKNYEAYKGKAMAQERSTKLNDAMENYKTASRLNDKDAELNANMKALEEKIREKNKETNKPEFVITSAIESPKEILYIPNNSPTIDFTGRINDESLIESILVNDQKVDFEKYKTNPSFNVHLKSENVKTVTVTATDIYGNTGIVNLKVILTETEKPVCNLITPTAENNVVTIAATGNYLLYLEGSVTDKSEISSIKVNGRSATFQTNKINPTFNATVETAAIDKINIAIKDIYGNESVTDYTINRDAQAAAETNPMGKTWVIFIENSNYKNISSLEAVALDVQLVKKALTGYIIDSTISKKNLSKVEMEKFFSIELRNLVQSQQVTSLLIWYSGHGKVTAENGYWLPVDANKKDEFTYFSTTNLKGYLGSYKNLKHTLVVADATETGPAFYLAMRDIDKPRECGDYKATKLRSAQVLSAAEPERNNESSLFSKAFANTLSSTQDKCISIDKISDKVTLVARQNQKQKPRFGNIQDLNDENGTFFFIRK